jgi:hypothetical protein
VRFIAEPYGIHISQYLRKGECVMDKTKESLVICKELIEKTDKCIAESKTVIKKAQNFSRAGFIAIALIGCAAILYILNLAITA